MIILANGVSEKQLSDDSKLLVVSMAGTETIFGLEASQIGLALDYSAPESKTRHMAGSRGEAKPMTRALMPVRDAYDPSSGR